MSIFTRGELQEIQAGVRPLAAFKTVTLDGGIESGKLSTAATLTTALTGTNNDMVFTADTAGTAGNNITVEYSTSRKQPGQSAAVADASGSTIVVDLKTSAGVKATSTVTQSTADLSDGETLTIGTTVYRFKSTMLAAYDVQIGVNVATTLDNLKAAINATGTPGTEYFAGTLAHPTVTATTNGATTQVIEALSVGTAGNSIATTSTAANYAWTSTVMAGGEDVNQPLSTAAQVKTAIEADTASAALVNVANSGADTGAGVVTVMAAASLSGGSDGKIPLFTVHGEALVSLRAYIEVAGAGASSTLVHGKTGTTNDLIPILTVTNFTKGAGIDSTSAVVARGTALAKTPLKLYHDGEDIFATVATAAATGGKLHYIADFTPLTEDAYVEAV